MLAALTLLAACRPASGKPEDTKAPGSETVSETESGTDPAETAGKTDPADTAAETKAPGTEPPETEPKGTEPSDTGSDPLPSAEDLAAAVIKVMKAQREYYADLAIYMQFKSEGYDAEGIVDTEHAYADLGTADAFLYRSSYTEVEIPALGFIQENGLFEAFTHGSRYAITTFSNGKDSVWTREDAAFPEIDFSEDDVSDLFDCESIEVEADGEGGLLFVLSGYTSTDFMEAGDDIASTVGAKVTDATVYLSADDQYRVTGINVSYVFEDLGDETPHVSIEAVYSDYDNVNPADLMELDPAQYDETVSDSEAADVIALFNDRLNADENAFALGIDQYVTVGDETVYYGENSVSRYQRTADGLKIVCYTVFGEDGENEGEIYYENGTKTVVQNGQEADLSWTEEEAEAFLLNAMLPVPVGMPSLAAKDADGYVCFFYDALDEQYAADMMGKLFSVPTDSELIVVFKTEDGAVSSVQYSIRVQGYAGETEVTLEMDYGVLFDAYDLFED